MSRVTKQTERKQKRDLKQKKQSATGIEFSSSFSIFMQKKIVFQRKYED